MMDAQKVRLADEIHSIRLMHKEKATADSYIDKRLQFSWQRLFARYRRRTERDGRTLP